MVYSNNAELNKYMGDAIRLADNLYTDLITQGLDNQGSKDKLISIYEKILKINVAVTRESLTSKDMASQLIGFYYDLTKAMVDTFEYLRKLTLNSVVDKEYIDNRFKKEINSLNDKAEDLEQKLYQKGIEIDDLLSDYNTLKDVDISKCVAPEQAEKVKALFTRWAIERREFQKQIEEKDDLINKLRRQLESLMGENERFKVNRIDRKDTLMKNKPAFNSNISTEQIVNMYNSGMGLTPYKIGQALGLPQQTIIYRLKQAGVYISKI